MLKANVLLDLTICNKCNKGAHFAKVSKSKQGIGAVQEVRDNSHDSDDWFLGAITNDELQKCSASVEMDANETVFRVCF